MWHTHTRTHTQTNTHITHKHTHTDKHTHTLQTYRQTLKQDFYLYNLYHIVCDWECWGRCVSWDTVLLYDWLLQHPPLEHCRVGMCRWIFWRAWSSPSLPGSPDPLSLQQYSMPTVEPAGETPHLPNSQKHANDGKHCLYKLWFVWLMGEITNRYAFRALCVCVGPWVGVKALQKLFIHSYAC